LLYDRNVTEDFIQNYILEVSDIILIVVGQLTFSDQKLISKITEKYKNKNIFIIHNFYNSYHITEIKEKIKNDILQSFNVEEKYMDKMIYNDDPKKK